MKKTILLVFISILLGSSPEFPNYFKDFYDFSEYSINHAGDYIPEISGIALATGTLVWKYDESIRDIFIDVNNGNFKQDYLNAAIYPAKWYGANNKNVIFTFAGLTAGNYLYGKIADNAQFVETSYLLTESFFITAGIVEVMKFIIRRARPFNNSGNKTFESFNMKNKYHSMPSGHTAIAFALANTIAMSSESYLVKIPAYTFAVSAGLQRIGSDRHWASDVLLGGVIGYSVSRFMYNHYYEKSDKKKTTPNLYLNFSIPL